MCVCVCVVTQKWTLHIFGETLFIERVRIKRRELETLAAVEVDFQFYLRIKPRVQQYTSKSTNRMFFAQNRIY